MSKDEISEDEFVPWYRAFIEFGWDRVCVREREIDYFINGKTLKIEHIHILDKSMSEHATLK
jgi:hypothetical protein